LIKKIFLLLTFAYLAVFLSSCSDSSKKNKEIITVDSIIYKPGTKEPFTGTWQGNMDSMKIVFDVVNGKKEGKFESYYPNGKVLMSGNMKNNRNVGEWKYFYDNGNLESAGIFENDKPEGKWAWYYPDGTLRQTGYFIAGRRDSIWKSYDSSGSIIDSVVIKSDTTAQNTKH
jgi:antitoxin component YwqK of YwqJK toxin-antitoxin module